MHHDDNAEHGAETAQKRSSCAATETAALLTVAADAARSNQDQPGQAAHASA